VKIASLGLLKVEKRRAKRSKSYIYPGAIDSIEYLPRMKFEDLESAQEWALSPMARQPTFSISFELKGRQIPCPHTQSKGDPPFE